MDPVATTNRDLVEVTARELQPGDRDGSLMRGRKIVSTRELTGGRVELVMEWSNGKRDRATPQADRTFRVSRVVSGTGMALRHRAQARTTGGQVEVWDTSHAESPIPAHLVKGHRWAMRCEHGTAVGRRTEREAMADVRDPRLWCVDCVDITPKAGPGSMPLPL
ncbi:hypothetical protein FJY71_06805 [candidate division WOR-3 bacterium]|nr:hypothetical protein [candidate division WOR-3 bacterium]